MANVRVAMKRQHRQTKEGAEASGQTHASNSSAQKFFVVKERFPFYDTYEKNKTRLLILLVVEQCSKSTIGFIS